MVRLYLHPNPDKSERQRYQSIRLQKIQIYQNIILIFPGLSVIRFQLILADTLNFSEFGANRFIKVLETFQSYDCKSLLSGYPGHFYPRVQNVL